MSAPEIIYPPAVGGGTPVGGTGTTNYIPRWNPGPSTLGDSGITDNGSTVSFVGRNITAPSTAGGASYVLAPTSGQVFGQTVASSVWYLGRTTAAGAAVQPDICVNASGNVGIGTASPLSQLNVYINDATNQTTAAIANGSGYGGLLTLNGTNGGAAGSGGGILFGGTSGGFFGAIKGLLSNGANNSQGSIAFSTRNAATDAALTERARIDSAGNLGIGVTPISPLHVKGNATNTDGILTLTPNSGGRNHQVQSLQASSLFRIYDQSAGVSRLEIDINGNISATTTGGTFNASTTNAGIKLPATPGNADTQTLDCYQENTWTPTLSAAATWGGTAPTVNFANYTRVGRLIFFEIELMPTAVTAFSATWGITSFTLPVSAPRSTAIAVNRNAASANAVTSGANLLLPTFALVAENMRVSGVYAI